MVKTGHISQNDKLFGKIISPDRCFIRNDLYICSKYNHDAPIKNCNI